MSTKSTEGVQPEGNYYDKYHSTNPIVKWMMKGFKDAISELLDIKLEENKNRCIVTVSNESKNLQKKDLDTIWNPFVRLDSAIGKEGHGLGLAIVAGVLENHKSKYGVYLSEGNIVNFWFELKKYNGEKNEEE